MKHMKSSVHAPVAPLTIEATGLELELCRDIMLKTMFRRNLTLTADIAVALCVLPPIVQELIEQCRENGMIETLGMRATDDASQLRYQLTERGKQRATDALVQSEYYGALPVTLEQFKDQTKRQSITDVAITKERLEGSMQHLVLPADMLDQLTTTRATSCVAGQP